MKKLILIAFLTIGTLSAFSQDDFKPYVSGGASISQGTFSKGVEFGGYNDKFWGALTYNNTEGQHYAGVKTYFKLNSPSKYSVIDTYGFVGTSFHVAYKGPSDKAFTIEPGVATVINLSKRIAPQLSLSFPVPENFKNVTSSFGVGVNIWLY